MMIDRQRAEFIRSILQDLSFIIDDIIQQKKRRVEGPNWVSISQLDSAKDMLYGLVNEIQEFYVNRDC